ncbi:MAG: flippase-like domain-containing protein [Elusimicrobia bacterium]|nr:flippase-like domain-containing protein [Elusimicrobiota bacterium]
MKRYGSAILGVAVTVGLLILALRHVSFSELAQAASRLDPIWLLPMSAIVLADLLVRALRWRLLMSRPGAGPAVLRPVWELFKLEAIGLALNNVLVLRLGEVARAYLAHAEFGVPFMYAMATVIVERVLDMMALLALFVLASTAHPGAVPPALRSLAMLAVAGLAAGLVVVSILDRALERGAPWTALVGKLPAKLQRLVAQAAMGSRALGSLPVLAASAALSLSLWIVDAGVYWMAARAMGLGELVSYGRAVVLLSTAAAACAVPAAPGAFGPFEQFLKSILVHWGVAEPTALAYAGIVHLLFYLVVTTIGVVFLYRTGHTLSSLGRAARERM